LEFWRAVRFQDYVRRRTLTASILTGIETGVESGDVRDEEGEMVSVG
jgi:hypothetical protein